jgi:hypothetical protein
MKWSAFLLFLSCLSQAQTAFVSEGIGTQYQPKYLEGAKDLARENAQDLARKRCGSTSEHFQRVSDWTYRRKSPIAITARATFVCGVAHSAFRGTVGRSLAMAPSFIHPRACYAAGTQLDLRVCDQCCSKSCSYVAGSPMGTCD